MIIHIERTSECVALVELSGADLEEILLADGLPDVVIVNEETGTVKIREVDYIAWDLYKKQSQNFLMGIQNIKA